MRDFARDFYNSKAWRETRAYIFRRDFGLCVKCPNVGEIVHHIVPLTPSNISDPDISLNENNLETVCRDCHATAHGTSSPIDERLSFDEQGNLFVKENYFIS